MNWIKKCGLFTLFIFLCSVVGGSLAISMYHKNWGSAADWTSGFLSLMAIAVAYYQIHEQKREYEKDKMDTNERFELNNRSQFSIFYLSALDIKGENYFINRNDTDLLKENKCPKIDRLNGKNYQKLKNDKRAYQLTNVTDNVAINVNIEIGYASNLESDKLQITFIPPRSEAIVFTHQMLVNKNENPYLDIAKQTKYIKLYFESLSGQQYVQVWNKPTVIPNGKTEVIDIMSSETIVAKERPDGSNTINFTLGEFI